MNLPQIFTPEEEAYYYSPENYSMYKDIIIERNMRLVAFIVHKHIKLHDDVNIESVEDFMSIGYIGLIKAVRTFDISNDVKFATYATRVILNELRMFIRSSKSIVMDDNFHNIVRIDQIDINSDDEKVVMSEIIYNSNTGNMSDYVITKEVVSDILYKLPKRTQYCILALANGATQVQIAKKLCLSRPYVSKIIRDGRARIRQVLNL